MPGPLRSACYAAACAVVLAGCGRSVAVQPLPLASPGTAQACAVLVEALPEELSAGRAWRVEPDPDSTRAWGSPPVVLRCTDPAPPTGPADQLLEVDGITWSVAPLTEGEQYTAVGRSPGVVVSVPSDYAPTAAILTEFADALAQRTSATVAP